MVQLKINGTDQQINEPDDTPLLWVLRDNLGMCGTKFGCGVGLCGACTVHVDGAPQRSCTTKLKDAAGADVRTIESVSNNGTAPHAVQVAWLEENVSQCGYCQPGQIMSAIALLQDNKDPSDKDIDEAMSGNLCRCGTYPRIRKAIKRAAEILQAGG